MVIRRYLSWVYRFLEQSQKYESPALEEALLKTLFWRFQGSNIYSKCKCVVHYPASKNPSPSISSPGLQLLNPPPTLLNKDCSAVVLLPPAGMFWLAIVRPYLLSLGEVVASGGVGYLVCSTSIRWSGLATYIQVDWLTWLC